MDGLMSEATDLILSSDREPTAGVNDMIKWGSRKDSTLTDINSVTLLRLSITNSIKDRTTEFEPGDIKQPKQNKDKGLKEFSPRRPKVDIQFLNSEEDGSSCVKFSAFAGGETNLNSQDSQDQGDADNFENSSSFSGPSDDVDEPNEVCGFETQGTEIEEDIVQDEESDNEQETRKKTVENGLKLARRKFSDGIFESCSTYNLTCPEVLQDITPSKRDQVSADDSTKFTTDKSPNTNLAECSSIKDNEKDPSSTMLEVSDDQISLSDSFFGNVTSDDYVTQKSVSSKESEYGSKKSSRGSSLFKENDSAIAEDATRENNGRSRQKNERRLNKRLRKRRKKSKSKDIPTYDCPKCGVSYVLSSDASDSIARCLHCDFWTSVEPVFLKREKQPWNTCRIC